MVLSNLALVSRLEFNRLNPITYRRQRPVRAVPKLASGVQRTVGALYSVGPHRFGWGHKHIQL